MRGKFENLRGSGAGSGYDGKEPASPPGSIPRAALSVGEFCASVGIGRSTFYKEVRADRILILKVGKRTLVPATELRAYLDRLQTATTGDERKLEPA